MGEEKKKEVQCLAELGKTRKQRKEHGLLFIKMNMGEEGRVTRLYVCALRLLV